MDTRRYKGKMLFAVLLVCIAMVSATLAFLPMKRTAFAQSTVKEWTQAEIEDVLYKSFESYYENSTMERGQGLLGNESFLAGASSTATDWLAFSIGRYGFNHGIGEVDYEYVDGEADGMTSGETQELYRAALAEYFTRTYDSDGGLHTAKATEWHRGALAYLAVGGDPTDANGINLIADGTYDCLIKGGPGARQGINGWIWGLLCLDYLRYEIPEDALYQRQSFIEELLKAQIYTADGGYKGWALTGTKSDPDITGMTMTALVPYYHDETVYTITNKQSKTERNITVKQAFDEGLQALSEMQSPTGDYNSWGNVNVESTLWAMIPLFSIGIDPVQDERFIKYDETTGKYNSLIDGIMNYNLDAGGFCHTYGASDGGFGNGEGQWNSMATDQATYALVAYWRFLNGQRTLYDLRPDFSDEEKTQIANIRAKIDNALALQGQDGYVQALKDAYADYNAVKEDYGDYIYNYPQLSDAMAESVEYTVTFKNGDNVEKQENVKFKSAATAPNLEKTGYTLSWDKAFDNVTGDMTVTAVWTINKYTVTFVDSDGTELKTKTVAYGSGATAPTPTKTGYRLSWDVAFDNVTDDMTVTAVWTINEYTVTFVDSDGTELKTETVEHGSGATAPTPTKTGYTLSWDKAFDNVTDDMTVTAVWTINKYTVTFKDGDTVLGEVEAEHGAAAVAPEIPTKKGYTFDGWDVAFDNVTGDLTVNAKWTENKGGGCNSNIAALGSVGIALLLFLAAGCIVLRKRVK